MRNVVCETIMQQLGGSKFHAMTGCKPIVFDKNTVLLSIPRNMSKANRLSITLDADDTYSMRFFRFTHGRLSTKTYKMTPDKETDVASYSGIYFDQLQEIFTNVTGMYTHL